MDTGTLLILIIFGIIIGIIIGAFMGLLIPLIKKFFARKAIMKRINEQDKKYKYILDGKPYDLKGEIEKELNNTPLKEKEERASIAKIQNQTYKKEVIEKTPVNPEAGKIISPSRVKKKRGRPKKK